MPRRNERNHRRINDPDALHPKNLPITIHNSIGIILPPHRTRRHAMIPRQPGLFNPRQNIRIRGPGPDLQFRPRGETRRVDELLQAFVDLDAERLFGGRGKGLGVDDGVVGGVGGGEADGAFGDDGEDGGREGYVAACCFLGSVGGD